MLLGSGYDQNPLAVSEEGPAGRQPFTGLSKKNQPEIDGAACERTPTLFSTLAGD